MTHPFPEKSVELYTRCFDNFKVLHPEEFKKSRKKVKYNSAYGLFKASDEFRYGFNSNLLMGIYAPWPHEAQEYQISVNNCTTIVPQLYLEAEIYGLDPKIFQYIDFREITEGEKEEYYVYTSHFAITVDVGKKDRYFIDPFFNKFGKIAKTGKHHIKIKQKDGTVIKRQFREALEYTPEEFAAMMERLKDPAESLDMLIAGQRIYKGDDHIVNRTKCEVMVYYDDTKNSLTTRLYFEHYGISDKGIYGTLNLDKEGNVDKTDIRFVLGKNSYWTILGKEKTIARTNFTKIQKIKKLLEDVPDNKRLVKGLKCLDEEKRDSLMVLVDKLWNELSEEEREIVKPQVLSRTLYEDGGKRYHYSKEEHDERIKELYKKEKLLNLEFWKFRNGIYLHGLKVEKLNKKEAKKLNAKRTRINKKINKVVNEINILLDFRHNKIKRYHRRMDMLLFAKDLEGYSVKDMEKIVEDKNLDYRYGYLAMVADFIPYTLKGRKDLELKTFMENIKEKVKARKSRDKIA